MAYCAECPDDNQQYTTRQMARHKLADHPTLLSERTTRYWQDVLYMNGCANDHVWPPPGPCPTCGQPDVPSF